MSYKAVAMVRRRGASKFIEPQEKWVTIANNCREEAVRAFHALDWVLCGGLQILAQEEANERVQKTWP